MSLEPGKRLGPYEILGPLGAGGMGEVYKARDTRLDRTVAVKVLPAHLAENAELRQRLEREARAVSSLNHPHICTLHDIGVEGGTHFLVLEHLEGESLGDRIRKGPLPVEEALQYASQIADALDKAHRQGVVHRDLKPGNVMITGSGAKLLDFGLAKSAADAAPPITSVAMTQASPLTAEGTIVGTFQYMSPEQLEGQNADARSDIFSFGALLYEMLAGRMAFEAKSQATLIAAIIDRDPQPISAIRSEVPRSLERLIGRCLAKAPDDRWQTASDLASELKWITEGGADEESQQPGAGNARLAWGVAVLLAVVAVVSFFMALNRPLPEPERTFQMSLLPPLETTLLQQSPVAISPDGRYIAFVAKRGDDDLLWIRRLDQPEARPLEGTTGAVYPFWAPDSRQIGFFSSGKLKKIGIVGGPAINLTDAQDGRGGTWNDQGIILFQPHFSDPLHTISEGGGTAQPLTRLNEEHADIAHRWPHFLPDGEHFFYYVVSTTDPANSEHSGIYLGSLDNPDGKLVVDAHSRIEYANGRVFYKRDTTLMAHEFDTESLEFKSQAVPVAGSITGGLVSWGGAMFSASEGGVLAFHASALALNDIELVWYDRAGKSLGSLGEVADYDYPTLSHDGSRLLMTLGGLQPDIWMQDLERDVRTRVTFDPAIDDTPIWSPDDETIVFRSYRQPPGIYKRSASGAGGTQPLLTSGNVDSTFQPMDWSKDGSVILLAALTRETGYDLWTYSLADEQMEPLLVEQFDQWGGSLSPDGRWIAYNSDESGRSEIYVRSMTDRGTKLQISTGGGLSASWRADGKELFYKADDGMLTAVPVETESEFVSGIPQPLFQLTREGQQFDRFYDVSSDGQMFIVKTQPNTRTGLAGAVTVIVNWSPATVE